MLQSGKTKNRKIMNEIVLTDAPEIRILRREQLECHRNATADAKI
jgi:hypothetical protein